MTRTAGVMAGLLLVGCSGGVDAPGLGGSDVAADPADVGTPPLRDVAVAVEVDPGPRTTPDLPPPPPGDRKTGDPCDENADCESGYCVLTTSGGLCTELCDDACPQGLECKAVTRADGHSVFLCMPPSGLHCVQCASDDHCEGGACLAVDGDGRCLLPCEVQDDCPEHFACEPEPSGTHEGTWCVPLTGSCSCNAYTNGGVRACSVTSDDGTCYGSQICKGPAGWTECTAPAPGAEVCDGVDNDCDGLLDEGVPEGEPCVNTVEGIGSCDGVTVCAGLGGEVCSGPEPADEACDGIDNDCDGDTDEDYRDEAGGWTLDAHCGYCGNACADKIPNGTGVCGGEAGAPQCVVESCDEGFFPVGTSQCLPPVDLGCVPCGADADCLGGSCVELDGQAVCVAACGLGGACADATECVDIGGGVLRCVPDSGSCSCTPLTAGTQRPCQVTGDAGTCVGLETCDPGAGWVGCTAATPAVEVCNGVDDDCDGTVDDSVGVGEPCAQTVEGVGSCPGVTVCLGSEGPLCQGPVPAVEGCDFVDDDCDGLTDEDFTDSAGAWTLDAHCGGCGKACAEAIANGVGVCGGTPEAPVCVVDSCDDGFLPFGDYQCLPPVDLSCVPCADDSDCLGGSCVALDGQSVCVAPCDTPGGCAEGSSCVDVGDGALRCVPDSGSCTCTALTAGDKRPCTVAGDAGVCVGVETCDPGAGWVGCTAATPAAESCNGVDDDCDGVVDDSVGAGEPCEITVDGVGTCPGAVVCLGASGPSCQGATPTAEDCDFVDDDCDGLTDEDFTDPAGAWTLDAHCGHCGNDCATKIPNGVGVCGGTAEAPVCVVETCDDGFLPFSEYQCLPPVDLGCVPCATDADCLGGSCVALDGQLVCVSPCDTPGGCGEHTTCVALEAGVERCLPDSGSCTCSPLTAGQERPCSVSGDEGVCVGLETCDPALGWVDCTAPAPQAESCNGVDDDCDGTVDDSVGAGEPCEIPVEGVGTCDGVVVCLGAAGATCQGPTPTVEDCDFVDDDCDGLTDENFTDPSGAWTLDAHCGSCGNDCSTKVANGVGVCGGSPEAPVCVVDSCDDGFLPLNEYQCVPPVDLSCVPCATDTDCLGGSCVTLDGQQVCVAPCDTPGGCAEGSSCVALDGGAERCMPDSGSCTCSPLTAGANRPCSVSGDEGLCVGVETCDPALGWVDCTAPEPAAESCNGVDDDCDGTVDDGLEVGAPCDNAVEGVGTCEGSLVCLGEAGWLCQGPTPAVEDCDFVDDDCDGLTDEDFTDPAGAWTLDAHCGYCGNDCATKIPNGTGACGGAPGAPLCVVESCDEGFLPFNGLQCLPPVDLGCAPCGTDEDCLGGTCVLLEGQGACATPCGPGFDPCVDGFACEDAGGGALGCLPESGSCTCTPDTHGTTRPCSAANDAGVCLGFETCDATSGWGPCSAPTPAEEACDGVDNDCDGLIDDALEPPGEPCETETDAGVCPGTWFCTDFGGTEDHDWWCSAPEAADEVCDFVDNDCDGLVDEPFRLDGTGPYVHDQHCGACGVACPGTIPNATAHCAVDEEGTPGCEVLTCDPGTYQAGPLTCLPVSDDLCAPCDGDAGCPTPGDVCVDLAEGGACGRDCAAGNLHGDPPGTCPEGFECLALGGGVEQCAPISGACSCLPDDAGAKRPCVEQSDAGICFGQETCDPTQGWVACTAAVPTAEVCNGVDDDCSAAVDDLPGRGDPCEHGNVHGVCEGIMDCVEGSEALVCAAPMPAADVCNGLDDDCDGATDDVADAPLCPLQLGVCEGATQVCAGTAGLLPCDAGSYGEGYQVEETLCDGVDNDCDGLTDEVDVDQDGHGPVACGGDDCDDLNPLVHEGMDEVCGDGVDNDCNEVVDDKDVDGDGHVDALCVGYDGDAPVDDCDDGAGAAHPGLDEVCGDGLDNDCDGSVDNVDLDGDKYLAATCGGPDCDDGDPSVHPGALEACDGADNDCNGVEDDKDADADGHVDEACVLYEGPKPIDDCDDGNLGVNPDMLEVCGNAFDEDCSGETDDKDIDRDGAVDTDPLCGGDDCDDQHPFVYPGAPEVRDGVDNDCDPDGVADEGLLETGAVVVTEIMYDAVGTPDENFEWFEVFNPGDRPVNMRTWLFRDTPGSSQEVAVVSQDVVVPPRGFTVVCRTGSAVYNGGVDCAYEYGFMQLGNTDDELIIEFDGVVVDEIAYDESLEEPLIPWPKATTGTLNLDPDAFLAENNDLGVWCNHPSGKEIPSGDEATPSVSNVTCDPDVDIDVPQLTAVHPDDGVAGGGTVLRLEGAGFEDADDVRVGGVSCAMWTVDDDHHATCLTPPGPPGPATVSVVEGGDEDTLTGAFVYTTTATGGPVSATMTGPAAATFVRETWSEALGLTVEVPGVTGVACPAHGEYPPEDLMVEVGHGPVGSDPSESGAWLWFPAWCHAQDDGADVFLGAVFVPTPGVTAYGFRVSVDSGASWSYPDLAGELGQLTVF